jgi:NADPH-dependent curcumin reductase CurA
VKTANTQCRLAARPTGHVQPGDFTLVEESIPTAGDGHFVVAIEYLSIDPAMCIRRGDAGRCRRLNMGLKSSPRRTL